MTDKTKKIIAREVLTLIFINILILFLTITPLLAEQLDGYFWNELSIEGKQRMVNDMRRGAMKSVRGVRNIEYFVKQLDDFYDSTSPSVLKMSVASAFSLICVSSGVEDKE